VGEQGRLALMDRSFASHGQQAFKSVAGDLGADTIMGIGRHRSSRGPAEHDGRHLRPGIVHDPRKVEGRIIEARVLAMLEHQHMRTPCQGDALAQGGVKSADARRRAPAAAKWVAGSGWPLCAHEMSPTT